jgi:type I restriction enzyme M protein
MNWGIAAIDGVGMMVGNLAEIERRLWSAADELRANSGLRSAEYSTPVLGLIFLRYADHRFGVAEKELAGEAEGRWEIGKLDYQAKGVMYVPEEARFGRLLRLPEGEDMRILGRRSMRRCGRSSGRTRN